MNCCRSVSSYTIAIVVVCMIIYNGKMVARNRASQPKCIRLESNICMRWDVDYTESLPGVIGVVWHQFLHNSIKGRLRASRLVYFWSS